MFRRPLFPAALAWLAGILILASGCLDQSPTSLETNQTGAFQAQLPTAVTPMRAAAPYGAATYSATINPAGGTIDFGIGTITFPKHAVSRATVITAQVDGENMAVEFGPHLTFDNAQPRLCFDVTELNTAGAKVVHIKDDGSQSIVGHEYTSGQLCVYPTSFSKFILLAE